MKLISHELALGSKRKQNKPYYQVQIVKAANQNKLVRIPLEVIISIFSSMLIAASSSSYSDLAIAYLQRKVVRP